MVDVDSQGHVVTNDGRNFKMNRVTQEIRIRSPHELPTICEDEIKMKKKNPNIQEMILKEKHDNGKRCSINAFNTSHEQQVKIYLIPC